METVVTSCKQICKSYQVDVSVEKTQQFSRKNAKESRNRQGTHAVDKQMLRQKGRTGQYIHKDNQGSGNRRETRHD